MTFMVKSANVSLWQYCGLGSSTDKLPQLKEQHHHLAEALDTTRHHIPTKDIYIPDNEEQYAGKQ